MRRFTVFASLLSVLIFAAACTPAASPAAGTPSTPSASPTPVATSTPGTTAAQGAEVRVYFSESENMQPVVRHAPAGSTAVLRAALTALLAGTTSAETAAGLHTAIPTGTTLRSVSISGKTATVDLSSAFASGGGTLSMTMRVAQIVFTATQFPGVTGVSFRLDGKPLTVLGGEGLILDHPQTRADCESATPAIFVDDPAWLGAIRSGAVARGTADVFEAVFRLQLRDAGGKLLVDTPVRASSGTGTRGAWTCRLVWSGAAAGTGELKVLAASPKDGKPIDVLVVPVTIAP